MDDNRRRPRRPPRAQAGAQPHIAPESAFGVFSVAVYDVAEYLVLHHRDAPVHGVCWRDICLDVGAALVHNGWSLPAPDDSRTLAMLGAGFVIGWSSRQAVSVLQTYVRTMPNLPPLVFDDGTAKALCWTIATARAEELGELGRALIDLGWRPGDWMQ
jgi:hypothetical protein